MTRIRIKRVYEAPAPDDGCRVLVDRLWPRGVRRDALHCDVWARDLAPSAGLRSWYPVSYTHLTLPTTSRV